MPKKYHKTYDEFDRQTQRHLRHQLRETKEAYRYESNDSDATDEQEYEELLWDQN